MCIDLYLTSNNPFYPNSRRIKWYVIGTLLIAIGFKPLTASYLLSPNDLFNDFFKPLALQHEVLKNKITNGQFLKEVS